MLRDIAGIRLCGANFDEVTNILLLDPHEGNKVKPVKGTLLYGRNGAGKSTLAKAVRKAKGESQDTISQAEFLSINNLPIESVCFFGVVFVFVCPVFIYRKCDRGCAFFQTLDLNIVFIEVERHFAATAGNGNWFIRNLNFQGSTFLCGSGPC